MHDTFVAPPGWSWDIVLYFYFGGIAGGLLVLSGLLRLVGDRGDRPLSRIGFYLAFPLLIVSTILLIKDLGRPERFWHMVFQSERFPNLMFKWWSPISFGTWIVSIFGLLSFIAFLYALGEGGIWRSSTPRRSLGPLFDPGRGIGKAFLILIIVWGLLLTAYTGILVMVTNTPTWSHDPLLPPMHMAIALATSAAALFLISHFTRAGTTGGRHRVLRTGTLALALGVILIIIAVLTQIGAVSIFFLGWWGALFWIVILPFGILAPLVLLYFAEYRDRELVRAAPVVGAVLLLAGAFLFRVHEVLGGQAYFIPY